MDVTYRFLQYLERRKTRIPKEVIDENGNIEYILILE